MSDEVNFLHKQDDKYTTDKKGNNIENLKKEIKKLSYEESIEALEAILLNIQDDNISLDKIQTNYLRGHILIKHCEELLQFVEQEIKEIDPENINLDID